MEKPNFLKLLPAILGFAALALPAVSVEKDSLGFWFFGAIWEGEGFDTITLFQGELFGAHPEIGLIIVTGVMFAAGAALSLLSTLNVLKLQKLGWLPGVVMLAGVPLYFIGFAGTELLLAAPLVLNVACGAVGGVWALVDGIKATRPA
jgi:hypothetical protein